MSKLAKLSILYPTNVVVTLHFNYLVLKGPFGIVVKKVFENSSTDIFSNIKRLTINNYNTNYGRLLFDIDLKKYKYFKKNYNLLVNNLVQFINQISTGFLSILQIWGVGYKILKKDNYVYIYLGYSHTVLNKLVNKVNIRPFDGTYFFITSHLKDNLLLSTAKMKSLKKKDVYKGKGIRFFNDKIHLKEGKKE